MKYKLLAVIFALVFLAGIWMLGSEAVVYDISHNIVRLHILANSNLEKDQKLKLTVRDELLKTIENDAEIKDYSSISMRIDEIEEICNRVIKENGFNYTAKAQYGKFYFPTKSYKNIVLPAGEYSGVRILLGEGEGENWWCVMYPPLCFTKETRGEIKDEDLQQLKGAMNEKSFQMIQTEDDEIKIKPAFKLVELWQELKYKIA